MPRLARPVRRVLNRSLSASTAAAISVSMSFNSCLMPSRLRRNERADVFAADNALDVAVHPEIEHFDRDAVLHAQRDGCRVHDLKARSQSVPVGNALQETRGRLHIRIGVVDAVDLRGL